MVVKETKKEVICIDYDGVIHDNLHPVLGKRMGPPIVGAQKALKMLKLQRNYWIVIFCTWGGTQESQQTIADWMNFYNIPFDEITNIKVNAKFYIDDKAVRFENWQDTLHFIKKFIITE